MVIRDYIDSWYKTTISSKEDFGQSVRVLIYNSIRNFNKWLAQYIFFSFLFTQNMLIYFNKNSCFSIPYRSLKSIDWEQFIISIVAHSLIVQMRILKKAREKLKNTNSPLLSLSSSTTTPTTTKSSSESLTNSNYPKLFGNAINKAKTNENNLIEMFFDLEVEIEKSICRDCISYNSKEIEDGNYFVKKKKSVCLKL